MVSYPEGSCRLVPHLRSYGGLKCLKDTPHQSHSLICKGSNQFNLWVEVWLVYALRIDASVYALGYRYLEVSISESGRSYTLWRWKGVRRKGKTSNQPREEIWDVGVCKLWSSHLQHKLGHDPESKDSTMSYLKFLRLIGESLGLVELYSFSLSKFCRKRFSC